MRIALIALVLVLASVPHAAGNAPPVANAVAPVWALLREPVHFMSTSYDPDGSIASTTWEFSDTGRIVSGATVFKPFDWPGVHAVTLRVTDNEGAQSRIDFTILVVAPLMHGRAVALATPGGAMADTGDVTTPDAGMTESSVGAWRYGALRVSGLDASVQTYAYAANTRATVGSVFIPTPTGYVLATGIETWSFDSCDSAPLSWARFGQLRHNDAALVAGEVPPNTVIALPGVTLTLNVHEVGPTGAQTIVAMRIADATGSVVEIARSEAGVQFCPYW